MRELKSAQRVLICLRYGIGDLVMETPALDALRKHLPYAGIEALGARPATDLLMRDTRVDKVHSIQDFGLRHWGDEGNSEIRGAFKEWLKAGRFDAVLDPSHAALGVERAIREQGYLLFDARDEIPDSTILMGGSGVEAIKKAVLKGWGLRVPAEAIPRIQLDREEYLWAGEFLRLHFREKHPLIAISPAGSSSPKIWPIERVALLGNRLIKQGCNLLLLLGSEGYEDLGLSALVRHEQVLAARELHLLHVAALLSKCDGLICNDTGLMHIAAAVETPVIGLFGPTEPSIYLPRQHNSLALQGGMPACEFRERAGIRPSPCLVAGRCLIGEKSCIHAIRVEDVMSVIHPFSNKEPPRKGLGPEAKFLVRYFAVQAAAKNQ